MPIIAEWDETTSDLLHMTCRARCAWSDLAEILNATILPMLTATQRMDLLLDVRNSTIVAENALLYLKRIQLAVTKAGYQLGAIALVCDPLAYQTLQQLTDVPGADLVAIQATSLTDAQGRLRCLRRRYDREQAALAST